MEGNPYRIVALDERDRSAFNSNSAILNRYFHTQASQDVRRRFAACYIAVEVRTGSIAGYYTLSAAEVVLTDFPPGLANRLPKYPNVPAVRLGRLAVDRQHTGQKLGSALLADAVLRSAASSVAVHAMIVDAKDEAAERFYRHHGFIAYGSSPQMLLAPIASLLP